ncbi:hypothetical protein VC899_24380 [Citrobacter braakii]|uniref:hypothetical protein n=1 Tax=Citrobacter braakii TaxID=57706 RepID=UPI002B2550A9|nr:hypothetical protein [Citrobacter braakii]MEB0968284.1 hypothetical protein [Citrobacter braakii]
MNKNEHQARFHTVQSMILEGGFEAFPGWKTFSYSDDFGALRNNKDGTAQFVYDTLSVLKGQGLLEAKDRTDCEFSVRLAPQVYQSLCQKVEPINGVEAQLIDYIKKVAPGALRATGLAILNAVVTR